MGFSPSIKQSDRNKPRRQSPETYASPILPLFVIPGVFIISVIAYSLVYYATGIYPNFWQLPPPLFLFKRNLMVNASGIYRKKLNH